MQTFSRQLLWLMVLLAVVGLFYTSLAQETSGTVITNTTPPFDPESADIPVTKEQFWLLAIAAITPGVVFLAGKITALPRPILPVIAPLIGILFGAALKQMELFNLPWWSAGLAGSAAVGFREIINQNITKRMMEPEESKTSAKPVDNAVAVKPGETAPVNPIHGKANNP